MNVYLLTRTTHCGYDEHDSMVVTATDEESAKLMQPDGKNYDPGDQRSSWSTWVRPDQVLVEKIGVSDNDISRVVCASFNAG